MSLKDKAIIIRVSASMWSARRYDRQASLMLTGESNAASDAARVNQYLLTGADDEFKMISQRLRELREFVDVNTVPWDAHGGRLITPKAWFDLLPTINNYTKAFDDAVRAFIDVYPDRALTAQHRLGSLLKPDMYPQDYELRGLFGVSVDAEAMPLLSPSDLRGGADEAELERLRADVERTVNVRINASITAQWERLQEEVTRLNNSVEARTDGKANRIYATAVDNLRNTAKVLMDMNITEDPKLDELCGRVLDSLTLVSADTLRISASQRGRVHDTTAQVMNDIKGLLL